MGGLPEDQKPFVAVVELAGPFEVQAEPVRIGAGLQLATRPAGTNAVELFWEINDLLPYDGQRYRSRTAVFAGAPPGDSVAARRFDILASTDGKTFTTIGTVHGPTNCYLHAGAAPGRLQYYRIAAYDGNGELWGKSAAMPGAAGSNLVANANFADLPVGSFAQGKLESGTEVRPPEAFEIVDGSTLFAGATRVVAFDPTRADTKQVNYFGAMIPVSPGKRYLQGGWVRAPGNVWFGRRYHDEKRRCLTWSYGAMAIRRTPEWTFVAHLLVPDEVGDAFRRRDDGRVYEMARKHWCFPPETVFFEPYVTAFGPGEFGGHWLVELSEPADEPGAVLP